MTRRALLAAGGAAGLGALLASCTGTGPDPAPGATSTTGTPPPGPASSAAREPLVLTDAMVTAFDRAVRTAFETFGVMGASVALVQGDRIVYNEGLGRRDLGGEPVDPRTRFRIGSNTKSMTSLLLARYVDDGLASWDAPVVELWPGFVGPTPELTRSLTLHQLLGMGSGIAEPETIEFFASAGDTDPEELLRSISSLEVIGADNEKYAYNNTLVAAAPYLVMLADGTAPADLAERYAADLAALVFRPIGMNDALVTADPRPFGADAATGYQRDLAQQPQPVPFVSIGGFAPAGSVLASSTDMANYLITQAQLGTAPGGARVASEENVRRTHQPGVLVPPDSLNALPSALLGDTQQTSYALGWFDARFTDGERMLWHAGGIDGFGSLMGFLPQHRLGFVALTNTEPSISGLFNFSVQASFLDQLLGLNAEIPALLDTVPPAQRRQQLDALAATRPVDRSAVKPYLGRYEEGFVLTRKDEELQLAHDIRRVRVRATADRKAYLILDGPSILQGRTLTLATDDAGTRTLTIAGFEPVSWLSGT